MPRVSSGQALAAPTPNVFTQKQFIQNFSSKTFHLKWKSSKLVIRMLFHKEEEAQGEEGSDGA